VASASHSFALAAALSPTTNTTVPRSAAETRSDRTTAPPELAAAGGACRWRWRRTVCPARAARPGRSTAGACGSGAKLRVSACIAALRKENTQAWRMLRLQFYDALERCREHRSTQQGQHHSQAWSG
jgi:hypothetical protein